MDIKLTTGAIRDIHNGKQFDTLTLQVMAARKFPNGDRSRLLISDGVHSSGFAILASQLSHLVDSGEVGVHAIVLIKRYFCNDVTGNKKMMIILEMDVLKKGEEVGQTIGAPKNFDKSGAAAAAGPITSTPAPATTVQRNTTQSPAVKREIKTESPAPVAPTGMPNVRKINSLTPYQNKWTICGRVTMKTPIRTWSKSSGEGKLFSINLLDDSGEIRATGFNQECDRLYDMFEANKVFYITSAQLKTANKQFNNTNNDYEMTFNSSTQVIPCTEESSIPAMQYSFVSLDQMEKVEKNSVVDLIAVCKETNEISTVTQKSTGKELTKRDIILVDDTNRSVNMTLWGEQAMNFDGSSNPVLAIKGAKVSDFGGVSLSLLMSSTMTVNPDIGEAHQLKGWWEQTGSSLSELVNLSNNRSGNQGVSGLQLKTFEDVTRDGLGCGDAPDYYSIKAYPILIKKENLMYMACPSDGCNKKVTDMSNGMFRCEKCNKEFDRYNWRLMVSACLGDVVTSEWVTFFQDSAETLLGCTANELAAKRDENPDEFHSYLHSRTFHEYIFKCRVKMETYNDERRLKTSCVNIYPINSKEYNKKLLAEIKEMAAAV